MTPSAEVIHFNGHQALPHSSWIDEFGQQPPHIFVAQLIERAVGNGASDLFLSSTEEHIRVSMRHLGVVEAIGNVEREYGVRCLAFLRTMADIRLEERRRPQDGRWNFPTVTGRQIDLRINTMPTLHGESVAIRILDRNSHVRDVSALGLVGPQTECLSQILQIPSGLCECCRDVIANR